MSEKIPFNLEATRVEMEETINAQIFGRCRVENCTRGTRPESLVVK